MKNVNVNVDITGFAPAGGVFGYLYDHNGTFENVTFNGSVTSNRNASGFASRVEFMDGAPSFKNCTISGEITSLEESASGFAKSPVKDRCVELTGFKFKDLTVCGVEKVGCIYSDIPEKVFDGRNAPPSPAKNIEYENVLIKGNRYVGGLFGNISGSNDCDYMFSSSEITVIGLGTTSDWAYIGGIAGYVRPAIEGWRNFSTVEQNGHGGGVGGLAGGCYLVVKNCFNYGNVYSSYNCVGGICGATFDYYSTIEHCTNEGDVTGGTYTGGICGNCTTNHQSNQCSNCTNKGTITGHSSSGQIIHYSNAIKNCSEEGTLIIV